MPLVLFGIFANLLVLGVFKYANYAAETYAWLWHVEQQRWSIVLPLGISFFTFQQISYLADTARGKAPAYRFHEYALYVCFFPQLIAGPIVRHNELIFRFERDPRQENLYENLSRGAVLLLLGLIKKVFIADRLALVADPIFAAASAGSLLGLVDAWTAPLAFGLQILLRFLRLLGHGDWPGAYAGIAASDQLQCALPRAVDTRVLAALASDAIALPEGLRIYPDWRKSRRPNPADAGDYDYHAARRIVARCWLDIRRVGGGLHGVALVVNHLWTRAGGKLAPQLAWSATMAFVFTTWVFFRAETFSGAASILWSMVGGGFGAKEVGAVNYLELSWLTIAAALVALVGPTSQDFARERVEPRPAIAALGSLALVAVLLQVGGGANAEFIYFQF